jgi:replication factor A1
MIKFPYEEIILKIKEQGKLSDEEINSKIKSKMDQLAGLITKEGAAHIIANELGIKIFDEIRGKIKINKILAGMRSIEIIGKVSNIYELKEFQRKDGSNGKVASLILADDTGSIRIVLWNDQTDLLSQLKPGYSMNIRDAYAKENNGRIELHINTKSEIKIMPGENKSSQEEKPKAIRKKIDQLSPVDANIELLATIVQVFEPRFYEVCPQCNKRLKKKDSDFACDVHGPVAPAYASVMNLILDDGSSTIRTVFFRSQMANLVNLPAESLIKFKDNPNEFQTIKDSLLGSIIKIVGRVSKNEMFDRLEFITQLVFTNPDPDEELKRLEEESKVIE